MCLGWCTEGGSSGSMQCVWKENGCDLNPLRYWVHGRYSGVRGSLARVAQGFMCKVCRAGGRKKADEFHFKDVKLECVCEFAYLGRYVE